MKTILKYGLIQILFVGLICLSSCSKSITGLYKHEICGNAPDCFLYDFCKDGRFTYWYSQDILGSATLTGNWTISQDTLYLNPDPYIFDTETKLICKESNDITDSIHIQIGLLPKRFKNKQDTTYLSWLVLIDNEKTIYETNDNGFLSIPYREFEKITVRDFFTSFGAPPLVPISDSIFTVDKNSNDIKILIADNNSEPLVLGVNDKLQIKWRRLFSIQADSSNLRPDKYIKIKNRCGNIKDE
jgi:hypothetical protein